MALRFIAIDPDTDREHCPAVFVEEETGDLLFALVNLARHVGADPDQALRSANVKFERRFGYIEQKLATEGRSIESATLSEMDALWNEAKRGEQACDR